MSEDRKNNKSTAQDHQQHGGTDHVPTHQDVTSTVTTPPTLPRECVGSLLVPAHDLQELSSLCRGRSSSSAVTSPPPSPGASSSSENKIMRRVTEELFQKPVSPESLDEMEEAK
jgi:hypothetical protein